MFDNASRDIAREAVELLVQASVDSRDSALFNRTIRTSGALREIGLLGVPGFYNGLNTFGFKSVQDLCVCSYSHLGYKIHICLSSLTDVLYLSENNAERFELASVLRADANTSGDISYEEWTISQLENVKSTLRPCVPRDVPVFLQILKSEGAVQFATWYVVNFIGASLHFLSRTNKFGS